MNLSAQLRAKIFKKNSEEGSPLGKGHRWPLDFPPVALIQRNGYGSVYATLCFSFLYVSDLFQSYLRAYSIYNVYLRYWAPRRRVIPQHDPRGRRRRNAGTILHQQHGLEDSYDFSS